MKKMFLSFSITLCSLSSLYAQNTLQTQQQIQKLQQELDTLKAEVLQQGKEFDETNNIIDNVETKSILDKINFAPELELRFDKLNYTNNYIANENTTIAPSDYTGDAPAPGTLQRRDEYTKNFDVATTIYFNLRMSAALSDTVAFHGKLSFANTTQSNQRVCILSRDIKAQSSSSAFDVTLAYFDYTPHKSSKYPYTFTFGLLPTSNGTPMQYAQNTKRESMFPALVFDMNSYGMIYTQKIAQNYVRAIVAQGYTLRDVFYPYQCNRENIDNATITGIYDDVTFALKDDTSILLSFGLNALWNFKAHPYLGPDVSSSDTEVLGDIYTAGMGIDVENLFDDLTLFAHSAISIPNGNGTIQDYRITHYQNGVGLTQNNSVGFTEAEYGSGEMIDKNGYAFYLGGKYQPTQHFNFGLEYNHGSKYWFAATQGARSMYNKLATRGYAAEGYINWLYTSNLFAKLGYLYIQENYTGSGWHFGTPVEKDAQQQIFYLSLHAKF